MTASDVSVPARPAESPTRRETALALRAVRSIRRSRAEGASRGDVAYAVYAAVMVGAIVAFPLVRTVVLYLAEPQASGVLIEMGPAVSATVFALASAGFVALGGIRGPATLSPFLMFSVAGNGHPRRRTLLRPVLRSVLALAVAGCAIALLLALVLVAVGSVSVGGAVAFAVAGALVGVVCGGCWVLGQRASAPVRAGVVGAVLASWALWMAVPGAAVALPWGWIAAVFPPAVLLGGGVPVAGLVAPLIGLGVLAVVAVGAIPVQLDGLRGPALLAQAQRWQTAGTLAFTGDLARAIGEFRAVPRRGRGLAAIGRGSGVGAGGGSEVGRAGSGAGGGHGAGREAGRAGRGAGGATLAWVFARRDLVGSLRTPARFVLACAGCLGFGLLIAVAVGASGVAVWIAACAAAIVGFLALGVWSDGFRHAAEAASAPALYGVSTLRLIGLHSVLPLVGGVVFSGLGVVLGGVIWGGLGGFGVVWPALVAAVLGVLLLVLVRVYDSAKGPLPLELMAPVPTPAGDASALVVAAWQADSVIVSCVVVATVVANFASGGVGGLVWAVVWAVAWAVALGATIGWMARRRILAR